MARALLSVSDKRGIVDFARGLADLGIEIVSTGGTARELEDAGLSVRSIEDFTGFPEIMDGRVKTLHPKLYGGLLAVRDNPEHLRAAEEQDVEFVDLVCVNLYPFERTAARRGRRGRRGDRADRHRRPDDDPGRGQEPRVRRRGHLARELRRGARGAADDRTAAVAPDPREPGRRGVRLHRALRHGDRPLVRGEGRGLPAAARARVREAHRPALRREPAPARGPVLPGRGAHARAVHGPPARRQGPVVQQPPRPQLGPAAGERVQGAGLRDHQAQQPVRGGPGRIGAGGLPAGVRRRPDERVRRCDLPQHARGSGHRRGDRRAVRRGAVRARLRRRRPRGPREQAQHAGARGQRAPDHQPRRARRQAGDGRAARAGPRPRSRGPRGDERRHRAQADAITSGRSSGSPGRCASTCAPTRSSSARTSPRWASGPAR